MTIARVIHSPHSPIVHFMNRNIEDWIVYQTMIREREIEANTKPTIGESLTSLGIDLK